MGVIDTDRLYRKGLYLEYFTVLYNVLEAIVSIIFGSIAGSIALIGFGLFRLLVQDNDASNVDTRCFQGFLNVGQLCICGFYKKIAVCRHGLPPIKSV